MDSKPCLSFPMSRSVANGEAPAHLGSKRIWLRPRRSLRERLDANTTISSKIEEAVTLADKIVVLGAGRDGIRRVIPVTLTRPRDLAVMNSGRSAEVAARIHLAQNEPLSKHGPAIDQYVGSAGETTGGTLDVVYRSRPRDQNSPRLGPDKGARHVRGEPRLGSPLVRSPSKSDRDTSLRSTSPRRSGARMRSRTPWNTPWRRWVRVRRLLIGSGPLSLGSSSTRSRSASTAT